MAEDILDELGPVDYLVIEFPGSKFNGEIAPTLVDLVERGIIRVLDLIMIAKEPDGSFDAIELSDFEDGALGELHRLETEIAELLSADDVENLAAALEPGSTAGVPAEGLGDRTSRSSNSFCLPGCGSRGSGRTILRCGFRL